MKKMLLAVIILCTITLKISAQVDTSIMYYTKNDSICKKEVAFYYTKFFKTDNGWHKQVFFTSTNLLNYDNVYADKEAKILQGVQESFDDRGKLESRFIYDKNKVTSATYFYPNGKINGEATFDTSGTIINQQGYDEIGKIIIGYIFQKESEFLGGQNAWSAYLQENLKANIPARKKAPVGRYSVMVSFIIDKDGKVIEATAANDPGYGTKEEAIRVIKKCPLWVPAINNGKYVLSRKRQQITFQVDAN